MVIAALGLITAVAPQRFRAGVDGVTVDVLVTRDGRPVTGLTAEDFELRDSGVRQQVQSVVVEDVPLNIMLALDISASVAGGPLADLQQAAGATLELLRPQDQVALLCFNHAIQAWIPWTADLPLMKTRIAAAQAAGSTALHDAAFAALTLRHPRLGRNLVLLFTDGEDTAGWLPGQNVIDAARHTETVLYGVGLKRSRGQEPGYRVDFRSGLQPPIPHLTELALSESFLENLARETGGRYIDVQHSAKLRDSFVEILAEFRSRYLLTYIPTGVPATGWHPLDVSLKRSAGNVRARRGYAR